MPTARSIQRTYLALMLGNTLAASFIWGINTIFLLDAGLSNAEAFAANAFFTAGMVIFEVPTGVVADTIGRRTSYLLGTLTLTASTGLYVLLWQIEAPFWEWAVASMLPAAPAVRLHNAGATTEHLRELSFAPDPADRATLEEEHALELRTRDRERKLLKKIEQSIARIDAGDYGYCDETGEPIGVGRLLARPTATLSLEAQQRRELKQKMFGE